MLPPAQPQPDVDRVRRLLATLRDEDRVLLLGVRGYYKRSMGNPAENDRGIYDDALILWNNGTIATWNFNTDPSRYRAATAERKGMAVLEPGRWLYKLGTHGLSRPK